MVLTLGVIGNGFVGKAFQTLNSKDIRVIAFDVDESKRVPPKCSMTSIAEADLIFISVPTPKSPSGACHLGIVESVVKDLESRLDLNSRFVVIRSTVPVGTSSRLNCYFMPEFLTEKNALTDFVTTPHWIFGLKGKSVQDQEFKLSIQKIFDISYRNGNTFSKSLHFVSNEVAEMTKLARNTFLATKVAFCNEIARFCETKGISYGKVAELMTLDSRIGSSHTQVPGPDGRAGFGGTCFPKDTHNLVEQMNQVQVSPLLLQAVILRNETIDRPEKDWEQDEGRAVLMSTSDTVVNKNL